MARCHSRRSVLLETRDRGGRAEGIPRCPSSRPSHPRASGAAGRPARASRAGALSYGFSTDLWTIPRIIQVTVAEWGVRYTETAMWRLLKRHGLSWQRPRRPAREKDLRAVNNWRKRSWPRYKKKLAAKEPEWSSPTRAASR